ncbi:MAG: thioredoxin domain-containing protein [Pseudomonadota bacterium]
MRVARITLTILALVGVVAAVGLGFSGSHAAALIGGIVAGWMVCATVLAWDLGWGLVLTMLAGMGVSYYLAHQHLVTDGVPSVCNVSATFNCDEVNKSQYSEMFGIPVALYGFGFYFAVAFGAALRRLGRARLGGLPRLLVLAGVSSLGYSAFLAWASHQLGTWCLFCISMYGINVMLMVAAVLALLRPVLLEPAQPPHDAPFLSTVLGLAGDRSLSVMLTGGIACFVLSFLVYKGASGQATAGDPNDPANLGNYYHQPAGQVQLTGEEPVYGNPDAPYLVLEWADYGCPYCARAGAEFKKLIREDPDVQLRFKDYPLSSQCNPVMSVDMHPTACNAAAATVCAQRQGRFWEMSDLLFNNQHYQSDEDIRFQAKQLELDMDAFEACMADPAVMQRIKTDVLHADALDITGTPTFFVKGLFGDRWVQVRSRAEIVEALVSAHRSGAKLPEPGPAPERKH